MSARPHLAALTGLRFLAAMHVVVFHYARPAVAGGPTWLVNVASTGYVAVSLFFILSGFVLTYTYLPLAGERPLERRRFWIARLGRIYPSYALALLLAAPIYFPYLYATHPPEVAALHSVGALLTVPVLVQAWLPATALFWNFPAWSLSDEAFFYALFPFVVGRASGLGGRGLGVAIVGLWGASLAVPIVYLALDPDGLGHVVPVAMAAGVDAPEHAWLRVVLYHPLCRLPEFLIGIALGRLYLRDITGPRRLSRDGRWGALALGAAMAIVAVLASSSALPFVLLHNGLLSPLFALLIYALAHGGGWLATALSRPVMRSLGEASYAVYILQFPVAGWARYVRGKLAAGAGPVPAAQAGSYFLVVATALVTISLLTATLVESPARRALRQRFGARPAPIRAQT